MIDIRPTYLMIRMMNEERENHSIWLTRNSLRIALIATFSALSVVLGYMLAYIPNIEVFTLMIFLSGFILGRRDGLIIGLLSSMIFAFFNPLGPSPPPLFAYQVLHYSLTGLLGGVFRKYFGKKEYFKPYEDLYIFKILVVFGMIGAALTFIFDILSTLFGGFIVSFSFEYFIATYISGIIFTTIHLIGNVLGFIFLLPGLIQLIMKLLD